MCYAVCLPIWCEMSDWSVGWDVWCCVTVKFPTVNFLADTLDSVCTVMARDQLVGDLLYLWFWLVVVRRVTALVGLHVDFILGAVQDVADTVACALVASGYSVGK